MSARHKALALVLLASLLATGCGAVAPTATSVAAIATRVTQGPASTPLPPSATVAPPTATVVPPTPIDTPLPPATTTPVPPTAVPSATPTPAPLVLLENSPQPFGRTETFQAGLGDLDGDGDLDAVFANMGANHSQVWFNDGGVQGGTLGQFTDSGQQLTQQGHGVGLGDLDGDGDLDIFMTCAHYRGGGGWSKKPSRVYLNDGRGTFQDSGQDLGDTELSGNGVNLIDLDGDGDLDAHVIYYEVGGMPDRVYLNDGAGRFSDSGLALQEEEIAWGDLDADGDVDMLAKAYGEGYRALLNDGTGRFVTGWQLQDSQAMYGDLALADLDGDGDLDALVASGFRSEGSFPTRLLWNDGTGQFTDSGQELNETMAARFAVGDLDRDGSLDVFVSNGDHQLGEAWLNDGAGHFVDSGLRLESPSRHLATWPSLGDLDGDGDLDLVEAGFEGKAEVWLNRTALPAAEGGGGLIAFASNQDGDWDIYTMDVDEGSLRQLTHNDADDLSPSWSPDGAQIVFVSNRDGNDEIYRMNADGSDQRRLTETDASESFPAWSPDGVEISFDSNRDGNWEIYVMTSDGGNVRKLTKDPADDWITSWSPDGSHIAFESKRDGNFEIYVMDADGSNQQRLIDSGAHEGFPAWSPDGTQIAFMSQRDGNYEIYVMNTDGTNQRRVTNNPAEDSDPAWSPGGDWLTFVSRRDGNDGIYIMKTDGGSIRRLTDNGAQNWTPAWQPFAAPGGRANTWIRAFEGSDYGAFFDITLTGDGNVLAVGATNHLHVPPYSGDALLMKLSLDGDVLWERTWGGDGYEQAWSIAQADAGGYYVFGETDSYGAGDRDFFLLKIAEDGSEDWFKTYGRARREWPYGMLRLSNGDLLIYGFTEPEMGSGRNQYALRVRPDGEVIWEYAVSSPGEELVIDALEMAEGDLILAVVAEEDGKLVKLDANGNVRWANRYELAGWQYASQIAQTDDGGFLLAGFSMSSGSRQQADTWLAHCTPTGELEWEKSFGDEAHDDYATSLIRLEDGTYLIGGIGNGMLLSRVDQEGNVLWRRSLVGQTVYGADGLIELEDGGYLVAGFIQITNGRSYDAILLRTDAEGQIEQ